MSRVVTCGGTDRRTEGHDEANIRFSLFKSPSSVVSEISHGVSNFVLHLG